MSRTESRSCQNLPRDICVQCGDARAAELKLTVVPEGLRDQLRWADGSVYLTEMSAFFGQYEANLECAAQIGQRLCLFAMRRGQTKSADPGVDRRKFRSEGWARACLRVNIERSQSAKMRPQIYELAMRSAYRGHQANSPRRTMPARMAMPSTVRMIIRLAKQRSRAPGRPPSEMGRQRGRLEGLTRRGRIGYEAGTK
jgi:hypothetical protein